MNDLIDARTPRQEPEPRGYAKEAAPLYVEVNHGRWLVKCRECAGAELANPKERWFWCRGCYNHRDAYMLLPVVWPDDPDAVAKELGVRPTENRNWTPGETVDLLRAENIEHVAELRALRDSLREQAQELDVRANEAEASLAEAGIEVKR
jgi:hypothetical protein